MAKREFLLLAHTFKNEHVGGWFWSEKIDGCRAFWDGGITRGILAADVPFANTTKDARYVTPPRATGLWSRYGKPIQAPDWWLDQMPNCALDGELYMGRGKFQTLMSTVKTLVPGPDWSEVHYMAFDSPPMHAIFANGEIDNTNFKKEFRNVLARLGKQPEQQPLAWDFSSVNWWLESRQWWNSNCRLHWQGRLSTGSKDALEEVSALLDGVTRDGGEGLMLRHPYSFWAPCRSRQLLKVKGMNDAEAVVIGYTAGRETDKGSKLLGKMGALVVKYGNKIFELSGFTDEERTLSMVEDSGYGGGYASAFMYAAAHPGERLPDTIHNPKFPRGSVVSFRYRELTDAGLPKEARFWRKYETES